MSGRGGKNVESELIDAIHLSQRWKLTSHLEFARMQDKVSGSSAKPGIFQAADRHKIFHLCALALVLICSVPVGVGAASPNLTLQGPAEPDDSILKDPLGRKCLDVEAAARAHTTDPNFYDHIISLKNNCYRPIKASVCYFNSDRCTDVMLGSGKRVDTILGSSRGERFFRFLIKQKWATP